MKLVEPYVSQYILHCLFPNEPNTQIDYVYDVLRESNSRPDNVILSNVLDVVRQSDPADPTAQKTVRDYVVAMVAVQESATEYRAIYSIREGTAIFTIHHKGRVIGVTMARQEKVAEACRLLEEQFPGIEIRQTS